MAAKKKSKGRSSPKVPMITVAEHEKRLEGEITFQKLYRQRSHGEIESQLVNILSKKTEDLRITAAKGFWPNDDNPTFSINQLKQMANLGCSIVCPGVNLRIVRDGDYRRLEAKLSQSAYYAKQLASIADPNNHE